MSELRFNVLPTIRSDRDGTSVYSHPKTGEAGGRSVEREVLC